MLKASLAQAGSVAYEFGALARWGVGVLVVAGGVMLMLLGAATPAILSSTYGQLFAIKLILFAGVLALAGVNKLSLTPALRASMPGAGTRLRRSIGCEAVLVAGVLITTATLTTVSAPSGNGGSEQAAVLSQPLPNAQQNF